MSDLQIVLIVIGVLIILAVLMVNWWQERKFHQQVNDSFSPLQSDALLDDFDTDDPYHNTQHLNQPSLDAAGRHHDNDFATGSIEDNDFSFKKPLSDVEFSFDVKALDDVNADFIVPTAKVQPSSHANVDLNEKTAQHYDIKAIFADAFSHAKDPDSDRDEPLLAKKHVIFNQENVSDLAPTKDSVRIEPKFEGDTLNNSNSDDLKEHVLDELKSDEFEVSLPTMLNGQMDLTALLYLADASSLSSLTSTLASLLEGYDKPVFVHVLQSSKASDDFKNQVWHSLNEAVPHQLVTRVACSLQLADRAGAVTRYMLNRFQLAVETAGLDINAHVEWQSSGDALTTATALDSFCIDVDKTIGFHLVHGENGAFTGTKLRGLAEAQGFTLSADGLFKYFDVTSRESTFVMFNREDNPFSAEMLRASVVKGVTFQFDIPHIKQCTQAFSQMVQVARQMEIGLNAVLVDDNNRLLGDIQIEKIRQQLKVIHATMLVRGIIPGSDSALRLFS